MPSAEIAVDARSSRIAGGARRARPAAAALGGALLLGGCAGLEPAPDALDTTRPAVAIGTASDAELETSGLQVLGTYTAASGRLCRRLADADGRVVARSSCRAKDGSWVLGRPLGRPAPDAGAAIPSPRDTAGAVSGMRATPTARRAATDTSRPEATPRGFAERPTGDPANRTRIAELNGPGDATAPETDRKVVVSGPLPAGEL